MKCYRKNGSDWGASGAVTTGPPPSMKCYRKNGSDSLGFDEGRLAVEPSMKCYRKNGSDPERQPRLTANGSTLNEVLPKER